MNYGSWITIAFILFAGLIISLVVVCVKQDISLVSADYYQQEIKYQQRIDDISNTTERKVDLKRNQNKIDLSFGENADGLTGEVLMFRPSDANLDRSYQLRLDSEGQFQMDISALKRGLWKMKISWKQNGQTFFEEKTIVI